MNNARLIVLGIVAAVVLLTSFTFVGCERIDAGHIGLRDAIK